jgi:CTP synthase
VDETSVMESIDASTIYDVPLLMQKEKLDIEVLKKMKLPVDDEPNLEKWKDFLYKLKNPRRKVIIGLIGKYVELKDAYKSIIEALTHAGAENEAKVHLKLIKAEDLEHDDDFERVKGLDGILVAPGFGDRGIEGKIKAITYARTQKVPFLGICLGMQCAVIEFARNVLGFEDAHSTEMHPETNFPVIDIMEDQKDIDHMGGTMRLGGYTCKIEPGTIAQQVYQQEKVVERHRHRYEFNNKYLEAYEKNGMKAAGRYPDKNLVEIIELESHPWFVGVQFHPEYSSSVDNPHPLFIHFVRAAIENQK